jgi:hypothetical protein
VMELNHDTRRVSHMSDNLFSSGNLVVLVPCVDLLTVILDGFLRRDVCHGIDKLVSQLVLLIHPLHPLRVGLVEGFQTDCCALCGDESLVGTKDSEQTVHEIR